MHKPGHYPNLSKHFAQQDATANPPRSGSKGSKSFGIKDLLQNIRSGADPTGFIAPRPDVPLLPLELAVGMITPGLPFDDAARILGKIHNMFVKGDRYADAAGHLRALPSTLRMTPEDFPADMLHPIETPSFLSNQTLADMMAPKDLLNYQTVDAAISGADSRLLREFDYNTITDMIINTPKASEARAATQLLQSRSQAELASRAMLGDEVAAEAFRVGDEAIDFDEVGGIFNTNMSNTNLFKLLLGIE
jgi:hypothetical protein